MRVILVEEVNGSRLARRDILKCRTSFGDWVWEKLSVLGCKGNGARSEESCFVAQEGVDGGKWLLNLLVSFHSSLCPIRVPLQSAKCRI